MKMLRESTKHEETDKIWWTRDEEKIWTLYFTFDKKKIYNLYKDYPDNLTLEGRRIFEEENPDLVED